MKSFSVFQSVVVALIVTGIDAVGTTANTAAAAPAAVTTPSVTQAYSRILYGECNATKCNSTAYNTTANVTTMPTFTAHHDTQTCSASAGSQPFYQRFQGVNLGGWMELEPWITPGLFYQFMGKHEGEVGIDQYTFCEVLGPVEGNRQLHRHWKNWVTEAHIKELASMGVNTIRLPVGDFIFKPYGPYVGCVDGGLAYIDQFLTWAAKYNINVFIDIHCQIGSQNGFDNSGQAMDVKWSSNTTSYPTALTTFEHWPVRAARWLGDFNRFNLTYEVINYAHIQHSLDTIQIIVDLYKNNPAVIGLQPVNEPFEESPLPVLKQFYWDGYLVVKESAPHWKYIMHDSFRFSTDIWGGFMAGCPDRVLDTHQYQAWWGAAPRTAHYYASCANRKGLVDMELAFGPVIVGEFSLATDNCAMWLNGFNDNIPAYPKRACKYISCGNTSYLGPDQPHGIVNKSKPYLGPYGTGISGPDHGMCPVDRDWMDHRSIIDGEEFTQADYLNMPPKAPRGMDDTVEVRNTMARSLLEAYSFGHGHMFWNFRTELYEPAWSFPDAVKAGYMPTGDLNTKSMQTVCDGFRNGTFICVCDTTASDAAIQTGLAYAIQHDNTGKVSHNLAWLKTLTGPALWQEASAIFTTYYEKNRLSGATCDFDGAATLQYLNVTWNAKAPDSQDKTNGGETAWLLWMIIGGVIAAAVLILVLPRNRHANNEKYKTMEEKALMESGLVI